MIRLQVSQSVGGKGRERERERACLHLFIKLLYNDDRVTSKLASTHYTDYIYMYLFDMLNVFGINK